MRRDAHSSAAIVSFGPMARALYAGVRAGELGVLAHEARRRAWSDWRHYGLSRDLDHPFAAREAKVEIAIRPLRDDDVPKLLNMRDPQMAPRGPYVRMHRLRFLRVGLGTCWVAARVEDDEPCYMQYLIPASQNERIREYFGGIFPPLEPDEALLEYAFTPERFQGLGIMPAAMAQIAEQAAAFGARRVITFVDHENVAALKGCHRSGFREYLTRTDEWRLFRRMPVFAPLTGDLPDLTTAQAPPTKD
jgi:RimJ/RimL family protein N-acetyltransferase